VLPEIKGFKLKVRSFAIALGVFAVLASGCGSSSDNDVTALEDRIAELEASATTTTPAPTTTTTTPAPTTTTTTPAPTTTTTSAEVNRYAWEVALGAVGLESGYFDGFSSDEVLEAAYKMCESFGVTESPVAVVITVASMDDPEFINQFSTLLGAVQIAPGCKTESQRLATREAFDFLKNF